MTNLFRTPIRDPEGPRVTGVPNPPKRGELPEGPQLTIHMRIHGGYPVNVLIEGGVPVEYQKCTVQQINAADKAYLGGHDYIVTDAERAVLEAAGYEVLTV